MTKTVLSFYLSIVFLIIFSAMAILSINFLPLARLFPLVIASLGVVLAFASIIASIPPLLRVKKEGEIPFKEIKNTNSNQIETPVTHDFKTAAINFLWIIGFFLLILLFGFILASLAFITFFLKRRASFNWIQIIISNILTLILLIMFGNIMNLSFPKGIISSLFFL